MPIHRLAITHFRNIDQADVVFSPQLNIISGHNGSGKTSLLEAIHFLATARSFRTHKSRSLIQHDEQSFVLFGEVNQERSRPIPIGIQRSPRGTTVRIAGSDATSLTQLLGLLPLQFLGPDTFRVLEAGPSYRRRILDWGVFHVEHSFFRYWYRYDRLLRQRNALLRQRESGKQLDSWDLELSKLGELITQQRRVYLTQLLPVLSHCIERLLPELSNQLNTSFAHGWQDNLTLFDALKATRLTDVRHGHTAVGPHRADVAFNLGRHAAKDILSRGQQKMLIAAFRLAQSELHNTCHPDKPCLMMYDDLLAELDIDHASLLLEQTLLSGSQLIVTTLDKDFITRFSSLISRCEHRVFHVEQGEISVS